MVDLGELPLNIYFFAQNSQNVSCNLGPHTAILPNLSQLLNLNILQLQNEPSSVIFGRILGRIMMKYWQEGDIMQKGEICCSIMVATILYCKIEAGN